MYIEVSEGMRQPRQRLMTATEKIWRIGKI